VIGITAIVIEDKLIFDWRQARVEAVDWPPLISHSTSMPLPT